jgi:ribosomal protein S17E
MAWRDATPEELELIQGGTSSAGWREATPEEVALIDPKAVRPGDVEARKKQLDVQGDVATGFTNKLPENTVRERLGPEGADPLQALKGVAELATGRGGLGSVGKIVKGVGNDIATIGSEFFGGIKDTLSAGNLAAPPPEATLQGILNDPRVRAALGIARTVASPLAPASDKIAALAEKASDAGLPDVLAGLGMAAADVAVPSSIFKAAGVAKPRIKDVYKSNRTKIAEKTDELTKAEAALPEQLEAIRLNTNRNLEGVEQMRQGELAKVPSAEEVRARFAPDAPKGTEVGAQFKENYFKELRAKKADFNERYAATRVGTDDIEVPAKGYEEALETVLGQKGISRPLRTEAERIASKAQGAMDVEEAAADQLEAIQRSLRNASGDERAMLEGALKEHLQGSGNRLPQNPTVKELTDERLRLKVGLRRAQQTSNDPLTRQYNLLINGIESDLPEAVRQNLKRVDKEYVEEFVPFFSKGAVPRGIVKNDPQDIVDDIIRTTDRKRTIEAANRSWQLMDAPLKDRTRRVFVNKGIEEATSGGAFSQDKFVKWVEKYADEAGTGNSVLKTVLGKDYQDFQSVVRQMSTVKTKTIDQIAADLTKHMQTQGEQQSKSAIAAHKLMKKRIEEQVAELSPHTSMETLGNRLTGMGAGILVSGAVARRGLRAITGFGLALSPKLIGPILSSVKGRSLFKAMARATPGTSQAAAVARQMQNLAEGLEEYSEGD